MPLAAPPASLGASIGRRHLAMSTLYLGRTDEALRLLEMGFENG